jgi:Domain of unknown function (DUF4861)
VKNDLDLARPSESITLKWADVSPMLGKAKADHVIALDSDGKEIPIQPIFLHDTQKVADELVFQADFAAKQERTFTLKPGTPAPYEPKVYGRWVPERLDDFGWENDRIAYRIYGPKLEKVEPACSGVDVWPKKTRALIINKWYQLAQSVNANYYHTDHGEGLDCYKVAHAQGCGGTALWSNGKRITTGIKGWQHQKVLANGPIRLIFELTYDPIDLDGIQVSETKRVTLDAGQNLNHYECTFTTDKPAADLTICPGIMEHTDRECTKVMQKSEGWMTNWDAGDSSPATKDNGNVGVGLAIDPAKISDMIEADEHLLVLAKATPGQPVSFWAGAGWDRSGDFADSAAWNDYLQNWSRRMASPVKVTIEEVK